jgi:hypothetical protein
VIAPDKTEIQGPIYTALRRAGHELVNSASSLSGMPGKLAAVSPRPDLLIVRADMAAREQDQDVAALQLFAGWPVLVLLPRGRLARQSALEAVPHVCAVRVVPPFDFSGLDELCAPAVRESAPAPVAQLALATPAPQPSTSSQAVVPVPRRQVRVGFYGTRGGVGVSTAALKVAQALAARGQQVALFDVAERGDLHVLLGREPVAQVMVLGNLSVFMGPPSEVTVQNFEAVIVDGGRQAGAFNAEWIEVKKPLSEQGLADLVGSAGESKRAFGLGGRRLLVVDLTD